MKVTTYSAAINSLLSTSLGQLGMGSRHPELTIDQAYMVEVKSADDLNLNILNGVATAEHAESIQGGDGKDLFKENITITEVSQIHIRNTGKTVMLASMDYNDQADAINALPIAPGGEIAIFSHQEIDGTTTLDLVSQEDGEVISAKVFVSGCKS